MKCNERARGRHAVAIVAAAGLAIAMALAWISGASAGWFEEARLTFDDAASTTSPNNSWCVAADDAGNVHVVWYDMRDGSAQIYYKMYDGSIWSADLRLTVDGSTSNYPAVAACGNRVVHVVWHDNRDGNFEIYHKMFDGTSWSADERLTNALNASWNPGVAVGPDSSVHVVWHDLRDGATEVYYKKYDGSSWGPDTRLTVSTSVSSNPCAAVDSSGNVHVVWNDSRNGNFKIYYKKYDGSWGPDTQLTSEPETAMNPCIAAQDDGNLHVVWEDYRDGNFEIYHKEYDGSWGADERLTYDTGISKQSSIAIDPDGDLFVVWHDRRDEDYDIFYIQRTGGSWGPDIQLTSAAGDSKNPSVAMAPDSILHVVWNDRRDGNAEIYWIRSSTSNLPPPELAYIQPDSAYEGTTVHIDPLAGDNFSCPVSVWLSRLGEPQVIAENVILESVESITCDFNLWSVTPGSWDVVVWNPDGKSDTLENGFNVIPLPDLEIFAIQPDSGMWINVVHIDSITGNGFNDSTSVWLEKEGEPDLIPSDVVIYPPDEITCDIDPWGFEPGLWDVIVANPGGNRDTLESAFRVIGLNALEIFAIEPDSGPWPEEVRIDSITGDGFYYSMSVRFEKEGEPDLRAWNVVSYPPGRIVCDLHLIDAVPGYWDLILEAPDGQKDTLADAFYVIGLEKPVIYSIYPDMADAGESVHISDLSGDNFASNAEVWLDRYPESTIPAVNVSVEAPTKITCDIPIPLGASGVWDVVVKNIDGRKDTLESSFEIIGGPWGPDERLTFTGADALTSRPNGRCLAIGPDDNVHIVWYDYRHGDPEIYHKMYDGLGWSADERLTESGGSAEYPSVAVDPGNNVHVVWTDLRDGNWEIYYKMYDGDAWSSDLRLTDAPDESRMPAIAADAAGDLHVVWYDYRNSEWDVFYKKYDGAWSPDTMISRSGSEAYSALPAIAVDVALNVHTAWYDSRHGEDEIYYRKFNGTLWEPEVRLSTHFGVSWSPSIATIGDSVYVAWHDSRYGNYEIMSRIYDGSDWGPEQRVTDAAGTSGNANLAVDDSGHVYVVWNDNRDGNWEIYYNRHSGTAWTGPLRLTTANGESRRPFAGNASTGHMHVIWYDNRDGANEIYHKIREPGLASVWPDDGAPKQSHNLRILPNPFSAPGLIAFELPRGAEVRVAIYDIEGRAIHEMDLGETPKGIHRIAWDGNDRDGRPVSAGVYFVKVASGDMKSTAKVVLLR